MGRRKGISWKSSYFCQTSTNCHLHHSCSPYMASITVKPTSMCVCLRVPHCFIFQVFLCVFGVSFSCLHLCYVLMEAIIIILGMLYKCRGTCCLSILRKDDIQTFWDDAWSKIGNEIWYILSETNNIKLIDVVELSKLLLRFP